MSRRWPGSLARALGFQHDSPGPACSTSLARGSQPAGSRPRTCFAKDAKTTLPASSELLLKNVGFWLGFASFLLHLLRHVVGPSAPTPARPWASAPSFCMVRSPDFKAAPHPAASARWNRSPGLGEVACDLAAALCWLRATSPPPFLAVLEAPWAGVCAEKGDPSSLYPRVGHCRDPPLFLSPNDCSPTRGGGGSSQSRSFRGNPRPIRLLRSEGRGVGSVR